MERLSAQEEEYLIKAVLRDDLMLQYQRDPERWLVERFGEHPNTLRWSLYEGYDDHIWDGTPDPFKLMFDCLAQKKWLGIESATSTGKTYLLPRAIYWFLDCFPNSLVVTTAPKQQQLKAVLWSEVAKAFPKFKKIRPKAEMFSLRVLPNGSMKAGGGGGTVEEMTDMWSAIGVVSGVSAGAESATKMQGYHRENMLFVIEEAAGVPAPVFTAIKNTCTSPNNLVVAVGNPDASTDSLHQFCELPHVEHIVISAYDHPNVVTGNVVIHGAVTQNSIDQRAQEYGEQTNFYKSRVRGIAPSQAADALIRYDWLVDVTPAKWKSEKRAGLFVPIPDRADSHNALGIDVANSEMGDMACLAWGRKNHLTALHEFQCPNANDIAFNVVRDDLWLQAHNHQVYGTLKLKQQQVRARRVGVDAVGVGVGTINAFLDLNYEVVGLQGGPDKALIPTVDDEEELGKSKPMYTFGSLRDQMYFTFAQELQKREFSIEIQDLRVVNALFKELVIAKMGRGVGRIRVEGKPSIVKRLGKSPNMADAAVYWNWMRKARHPDLSDLPIG